MRPGWGRFGGKLRGGTLAGIVAVAILAALAAAAVLRPGPDARAALGSGDYRAAHAALREPAGRGDAWAQNALGNLYYLGLGVETDYRRAIDWYWKAAAQGNAAAQMNMGHLYDQGLGVARDPLRAFAWYRQAQQNGSDKAKELMRLIAGSLSMTPNQILRARELYPTVEALRP